MLDDADIEGTAAWALLKSGVDVCVPVDPLVIAEALGVTVVESSVRGCGAVLIDNDPPTIVVRAKLTRCDAAFALAHEIGHYALLRTGTARPHVESDVDAIARRILVPSGFVRLQTLTLGRTVEELPALCPLVRPDRVVMRARHVLGLHVPVDDTASAFARWTSSAA